MIIGRLVALAHGSGLGHLLQEAVILFITLIILFGLIVEYRRKNQQLSLLQKELEEARNMSASISPHVSAARHKLGQAIVEQFAGWQLSKSEQEVGLLLLKGCSLKEIALLRGTAEKTIRQQASSMHGVRRLIPEALCLVLTALCDYSCSRRLPNPTTLSLL